MDHRIKKRSKGLTPLSQNIFFLHTSKYTESCKCCYQNESHQLLLSCCWKDLKMKFENKAFTGNLTEKGFWGGVEKFKFMFHFCLTLNLDDCWMPNIPGKLCVHWEKRNRWLSAGRPGPKPATHKARRQTSNLKKEEENVRDVYNTLWRSTKWYKYNWKIIIQSPEWRFLVLEYQHQNM